MLGLVKPIALGINGDARAAAAAITEQLQEIQGVVAPDPVRLAGIGAERERWAAELAALAGANEPGRIDPRRALTQLARALPQDAMVARAMGAEGLTVEHEDQIGDALGAAIASNRPTVINLRLTQTLGDPFRRDAFRPPRRLLPKYAAHGAKT
ncbi:hypothetical protein [uncultured Thiodictyon sp.]|uniref:hypothetical protein n=1 Tax=uncultured Thiodictyon sp. TaxID=1846217 RepID=UPI0025D4B246|nr:hypothetical protein [uncultured Thiodictyon sp.]